MEWPADFHCSPLDESLYSLLSPSPPPPPPPSLSEMPKPSREWNSEENKVFENALAELDHSSPTFFESIASKVPWRSIEDIKLHYQALVQDIEMIESGNFPIPDYPTLDLQPKPDDDSKNKTGPPRRRGIPWTEEEHQLFLMGLNKYGKGDWRSISRYYVITKTPTQVASHAQKYFRRQTSSTPADRRRPSIHDIHTVSPAAAAFASPSLPNPIPFPPSALIPALHQNYPNLAQNPSFLQQPPLNAAPAHAMFNQAAHPSSSSSSFLQPQLRNNFWG
ncbi:transcription factor DIVARICATA-like [Salvia miltiorrhiza]|uniref:transcription factor DIVARICATA-like n=1 Tax=Salvia miltiorrhiza TaxID=226208 RepID=UPI0025AC8B37|nr:transcription factor DIVARICATA-like [Salvia miltiorrhiza]